MNKLEIQPNAVNTSLILATQSIWRIKMLENAGIPFTAIAANIDERAIENSVANSGLDGNEIAQILAISKAETISKTEHNSLIIGADQILSCDGKLLHKVTNMEDARRRLLKLSGKTHHLNTAVALVKNGSTIWQYANSAEITLRTLTPEFIGRYLARAGEQILGSVGLYQIEGQGVQLFDKIEGDYFTIMGLPLLPLIKQLRLMGHLDG